MPLHRIPSNILAGDYDITVTGANGCTDTETINVGNNNPPITVSANVLPNQFAAATSTALLPQRYLLRGHIRSSGPMAQQPKASAEYPQIPIL
jgi:hypothetical protein